MDLDSYVQLFWWNEGRDSSRRPRVPRALERDALEYGTTGLAHLIQRWDAWEGDQLTQEIFAQRRRVSDAQRLLHTPIRRRRARMCKDTRGWRGLCDPAELDHSSWLLSR